VPHGAVWLRLTAPDAAVYFCYRLIKIIDGSDKFRIGKKGHSTFALCIARNGTRGSKSGQGKLLQAIGAEFKGAALFGEKSAYYLADLPCGLDKLLINHSVSDVKFKGSLSLPGECSR
jgi:hypothetical protein